MSPECSLSGPPSIRNANMNEVGQSEDIHGHLMHNGDELSGKHTMQFRFVYFQFVIRISNRDSDFESNELKNRMLIDFTNFFQTQWPKLSQLHQTAWADIHVTSAARFSSIRAHFSTIDTSTAGHTDARHVERPSVGDGIWRDI